MPSSLCTTERADQQNVQIGFIHHSLSSLKGEREVSLSALTCRLFPENLPKSVNAVHSQKVSQKCKQNASPIPDVPNHQR